MNPNQNNNHRPKSLREKILIFTASLDERVLDDLSPADARRATTDGIFPLISMGLAFLSAFIFLTSTVKPPILAVVAIAGAWSLVVAFLEIKISEGIRQQDGFGKKVVAAFPRLFLALVVAFLIGEPLTQKIFQDDVIPLAVSMKQDEVAETRDETTEKYDTVIDGLTADRQKVISAQSGGPHGAGVPDNPLLQQLADQIDQAQAKADAANLEAARQWEGTGNRKQGQGPLYREAKRKADEVQAEVDQLKAEYQTEENKIILKEDKADKVAAAAVSGDLQPLNAAIREQRTARAKALAALKEEANRPPGHLLMVKATWKLAQDEFVVMALLISVIVFFMAVEIGLVLHRILQPRTQYDMLACQIAKVDGAGFETIGDVGLKQEEKIRNLEEKQVDIYISETEKSLKRGVKKIVAIEEEVRDDQIERYRREVKEMMGRQGAGTANGSGAAHGHDGTADSNSAGNAQNPTTNGNGTATGNDQGPMVRFLKFRGSHMPSLNNPSNPDQPAC